QALACAEGGVERIWEPELHRLKGELVLAGPAPDEGAAKSCFERAVEAARRMSEKSFELRAATSLARLWAKRGERKRAHDLLAPIYGWFTEGFDTADHIEAKTLLDQLRL